MSTSQSAGLNHSAILTPKFSLRLPQLQGDVTLAPPSPVGFFVIRTWPGLIPRNLIVSISQRLGLNHSAILTPKFGLRLPQLQEDVTLAPLSPVGFFVIRICPGSIPRNLIVSTSQRPGLNHSAILTPFAPPPCVHVNAYPLPVPVCSVLIDGA